MLNNPKVCILLERDIIRNAQEHQLLSFATSLHYHDSKLTEMKRRTSRINAVSIT